MPENSDEPPSIEYWNVFNDHVVGQNFANQPSIFPPKAGALPIQTGPVSRDADILAREPPTDEVGSGEIFSGN